MTAVSPTAGDVESARRPTSRIARVVGAAARSCRRFCGRLPGEYTVAKLDAFDRFRRSTSAAQVVWILLLTPMTCVGANLAVESIPLAAPVDDFYGSKPFLLRNFVTATIVTMVPFFIKPDCIPQLPYQSWKLSLGFGLLLGAVSTGTIAALIVITDTFPVPTSQFCPMIPMGIVGRLIESRLFNNPQIKPRLDKIDQWLAMVVAPILVYPIFTEFFMALKPQLQLWFSLLLPVIKLLLRNLLWIVAKNDLDLVGSVTCTIGHFYHVLFTAMCLQNAKSLEMLGAVMVVNCIQMLLNCRDILRDATFIRATKAKLSDSSSAASQDCVSSALVIAQKQVSECLHRQRPSRFFSEYPRYQGADFAKRHRELLSHKPVLTTIDSGKVEPNPPILQRVAQILPIPFPDSKHFTSSTRTPLACRSRSGAVCRDEAFTRGVTSALHQTEIILLRSYVTIFVMAFYGIYLVAVYLLPNHQFFATMTFMTSFNAVVNMVTRLFLLCGIEIIFLVIYLVLVQCYLSVSGVYQLAFVLNSQRVLIQGMFVMLSIMILGFPLKQYGNGVIFQVHPGS